MEGGTALEAGVGRLGGGVEPAGRQERKETRAYSTDGQPGLGGRRDRALEA